MGGGVVLGTRGRPSPRVIGVRLCCVMASTEYVYVSQLYCYYSLSMHYQIYICIWRRGEGEEPLSFVLDDIDYRFEGWKCLGT